MKRARNPRLMEIVLQDVSGDENIPSEKEFTRWLQATVDEKNSQLTVRLVAEQEMTELNQRYRQKNGPTNVLSFPFEGPPGVESNILGDIVICAPVVRREAKEQNKSLAAHWAHMVIHSALHLQGYDHENEQDAIKMEALEARIMTKLGFPAPYYD